MGDAHSETLEELCLRVGRWWNPDNPEEQYSGYVHQKNNTIEIRLGFESSNFTHYLTESAIPISCLWGKVGGKYISAFDVVVTHGSNRHFGDSDVSHCLILEPQILLVGDRQVLRDAIFSGVSFCTNEAHKIFRLHPLKVFEPNRDIEYLALRDCARVTKNEVLAARHALIETSNLNGFECGLESLPGKLSYQFSTQRNWCRESGPSLSYAPRLLLDLSSGGTAYRLMRKARHVGQLLSLLSVTPNYLHDFDLFIGAGESTETFRLYKCSALNKRDPSGLGDFQVLLGYPKYAKEYPTLWSAWFDSMERHLVPRWIFQSTLEQEHRFDINRFLNVMQCLEILANLYAASPKVDRRILDDFAAELESLVAGRNREGELRYLIGKMREGNRPALAERLQAVASKLSDDVLVWLLGDWKATLKLAAQARNYFTHFGSVNNERREIYEENLALLTCKMSGLYALLELQFMGFGPEKFLSETSLPWVLRSAIHKQIVLS